MTDFTLILGNKNYSSWSMRAWLCMKRTGAAFDEVVLDLAAQDILAQKAQHTPAGRVPVLKHGDLTIWDSLAIAEYLAEIFPAAGLWPADSRRRAWARSLTSEMHAGFAALREQMPMNIRASYPDRVPDDAVKHDIRRIQTAWGDCRAAHGEDGPFLFGSFTIADAFFAPVVTRFRTYAVDMDATCRSYADAVWQHQDVQAWAAAARAESWTIPEYEF
ncbi:MAG: glutathione S-transferase family protein [Planctomycetota bacterium]|jgi:glutathione S-transferase